MIEFLLAVAIFGWIAIANKDEIKPYDPPDIQYRNDARNFQNW